MQNAKPSLNCISDLTDPYSHPHAVQISLFMQVFKKVSPKLFPSWRHLLPLKHAALAASESERSTVHIKATLALPPQECT